MGNILQSLGIGGAGAAAPAAQAPMGAEWNPGFGMFGIDPSDMSKYLPDTAGAKQVGGPMSGMGIIKALVSGGRGDQEQGQLPPGTISEQGAMGQGQQDPDLAVTGDGWHPRKHTVLGDIADFLSVASGGKPYFAQARDARNAHDAMQGFDQDPVQAIRRLQQVRGYEDKAYDMYKTYQDDKRADMAAGSLADSRAAKFYPRIGGLLYNIQKAKDPEAAYQQSLPILRRLQQKAGDEDMLGDTYDADAVNRYISMNIDPEDQIKQEALTQYRQERLGLDTRKVDLREQYQTERLKDFDAQEAGRNARYNTPKPKAGANPQGGQLIRDPNGNVLGKVGASGKTAQLVAPDGGFQYFEVLPNGKLGKRLPNELFEKPKGK